MVTWVRCHLKSGNMSSDESMDDKMWFIYTKEHYLATKKEVLPRDWRTSC